MCSEGRPLPLSHAQKELVWTEDQKARLRPAWEEYVGKMKAYRGQTNSNLHAISFTAGPATIAGWESSAGKPVGRQMESYAVLVEKTGGLEMFLRLEAVSWIEVLCVYLEVSRPPAYLPSARIAALRACTHPDGSHRDLPLLLLGAGGRAGAAGAHCTLRAAALPRLHADMQLHPEHPSAASPRGDTNISP